jgi:4-diphosphocytidyl-2-C-methyl-D-erythritol kinase
VTLKAFAPAKINLFLHVGPIQPDRYHALSSWMVFADVGDEVALSFDEPYITAAGFSVEGPMAAGVPVTSDNLVLRARDALLAVIGDRPDFQLALMKRLPAASGIGGGSSDAAATLRLLAYAFEIEAGVVDAIAPDLGADVAACLRGESLIAEGRGERLSAAPALPVLHAVLVNPGVGVSTGAVFKAYDQGQAGGAASPDMPAAFQDAGALVAFLQTCRNDLEAPARELEPVVSDVLAVLNAAPETLFARMSGSGATCFALCAGVAEANALAGQLFCDYPDWWVRPCRLGGPWPDGFTRP